jgi:hypothetical protein
MPVDRKKLVCMQIQLNVSIRSTESMTSNIETHKPLQPLVSNTDHLCSLSSREVEKSIERKIKKY